MNDSSTNTIEASNKSRAISRAADVLAAYMSDARGWDYAITGREVMDATTDTDIPSVLGDLIADLMHLADYIGESDPHQVIEDFSEVVLRTATANHDGESTGDDLHEPGTPWNSIPRDLVHYHPEVDA